MLSFLFSRMFELHCAEWCTCRVWYEKAVFTFVCQTWKVSHADWKSYFKAVGLQAWTVTSKIANFKTQRYLYILNHIQRGSLKAGFTSCLSYKTWGRATEEATIHKSIPTSVHRLCVISAILCYTLHTYWHSVAAVFPSSQLTDGEFCEHGR